MSDYPLDEAVYGNARAMHALVEERVERDRLRSLLTTAYDLVAESIDKPQYDYRARAGSLVAECRAVLGPGPRS